MVLTEWAARVAYELMYQARQDRLHFTSTGNRGLIRAVGFNTLIFGKDKLAAELEALIDEIDLIKWSDVSPKNRALPNHATGSPVSITVNWIAFNTDAWESEMDESMHLTTDGFRHSTFDYPR